MRIQTTVRQVSAELFWLCRDEQKMLELTIMPRAELVVHGLTNSIILFT